MKLSIIECEKLFGKTPITLSAQSYLIHFYESLGFSTIGDQYLEDGIPHIKMKRKAST
jgi:ElaA protein